MHASCMLRLWARFHARRWGSAIATGGVQGVSRLNHEAARRAGQTVVGFIKDPSVLEVDATLLPAGRRGAVYIAGKAGS